MAQKIKLANDGIVVPARMSLYHPNYAQNTPAVRMQRLRQLIKTGCPHICIVRGEGIGDLLMVTPTIKAIRQMFSSNATITVATNTRYLDGALVDVLKYNPYIDNIIERNLLNDADYDLVINLHCPAIQYEKKGSKPPNRIDIFAQHAGVSLTDYKPLYYPTPAELEWSETFFRHKSKETKTIMVQLFSSSSRRSIDNRYVKDALTILYKQYGIESIVLEHNSDPQSDIQWDNIPGVTTYNLCIRGIAAFMLRCDLVLCPDSSLLHLAGALDVPTVAIFTSTYPQSRINHYPMASAIWDGDKYNPCPCWYENCPIGNACSVGITGSRIAEECINALKNRSKVDILSVLKNTTAIKIDTEIL